jgi:hypothetical protein
MCSRLFRRLVPRQSNDGRECDWTNDGEQLRIAAELLRTGQREKAARTVRQARAVACIITEPDRRAGGPGRGCSNAGQSRGYPIRAPNGRSRMRGWGMDECSDGCVGTGTYGAAQFRRYRGAAPNRISSLTCSDEPDMSVAGEALNPLSAGY